MSSDAGWLDAAHAAHVAGELDGLRSDQIADLLGVSARKGMIAWALCKDGIGTKASRVRGNHRARWASLSGDAPPVDGQPADPSAPAVEIDDGGMHITATGTEPRDPLQLVTNPESMCSAAGVDLKAWRIVRSKVNRWTTTLKGPDGEPRIVVNWQVKVDLEPLASELLTVPPLMLCPAPKRVPSADTGRPEVAVFPGDMQIGFARTRDGRLTATHDPDAIDVFLQVCERLQPDHIVLGGDNLDLPELSTKYPRPPGMWDTTQAALVAMAYYLGRMRTACPNARIHWLDGNHEERLTRLVRERAPILETLADVDTDEPALDLGRLMHFDRAGVEYVGGYPSGILYLFDDLMCWIHGTQIGGKGGQTVTKLLATATHASVQQGHVHRLEYGYKTIHTASGPVVIGAGSSGCLCDVEGKTPGVSARPDWQQGVLVNTYYPDRKYIATEPVLIRRGFAVFRGEPLTAGHDAEAMRRATGLKVA